MATGTGNLSELAQRLAQKQTEVAELTRLYEARLDELRQRRDALQGELQQVDAEIEAVGREEAASTGSASTPARGRPPQGGRQGPRLHDFLIAAVRRAGRPLTVKEMATEVERQKYPTKSTNVQNLIQARIKDLVERGMFVRSGTPAQYGLPGSAAGTAPASASETTNETAESPKKRGRKRRKRKQINQPPLRDVLLEVMKKQRTPLSGGDLAKLALDAGYQTSSQSFRDVVWVTLGNMAKKGTVELVEGKGYRLKK